MTSIYVKFDFLSMIVVDEDVLTGLPPFLPNSCHILYLSMYKLCVLVTEIDKLQIVKFLLAKYIYVWF